MRPSSKTSSRREDTSLLPGADAVSPSDNSSSRGAIVTSPSTVAASSTSSRQPEPEIRAVAGVCNFFSDARRLAAEEIKARMLLTAVSKPGDSRLAKAVLAGSTSLMTPRPVSASSRRSSGRYSARAPIAPLRSAALPIRIAIANALRTCASDRQPATLASSTGRVPGDRAFRICTSSSSSFSGPIRGARAANADARRTGSWMSMAAGRADSASVRDSRGASATMASDRGAPYPTDSASSSASGRRSPGIDGAVALSIRATSRGVAQRSS